MGPTRDPSVRANYTLAEIFVLALERCPLLPMTTATALADALTHARRPIEIHGSRSTSSRDSEPDRPRRSLVRSSATEPVASTPERWSPSEAEMLALYELEWALEEAQRRPRWLRWTLAVVGMVLVSAACVGASYVSTSAFAEVCLRAGIPR